MNVNRELLKGSISLLILRLLKKREMYGYEIIQEAHRLSRNTFEFNEGTLYPALHQLELKGFLKAEWRTAENGRERKYYSLTARGIKQADQAHAEWKLFTGTIDTILASESA
jgi:transcriptional regulator